MQNRKNLRKAKKWLESESGEEVIKKTLLKAAGKFVKLGNIDLRKIKIDVPQE